MTIPERQFCSGEARTGVLAGMGGFIYGVALLFIRPEMDLAPCVFMGIGASMIWRGVRAWRRPYVQLSNERLVVFERGEPKHYVDLAAVASVRPRFNQTILEMQDGMKIPISHLGFMYSNDAQDFTELMAERYASAAPAPQA